MPSVRFSLTGEVFKINKTQYKHSNLCSDFESPFLVVKNY